jgi:hypothetical protein
MIREYKEGRVCSVDVSKEDLYAFEQLKLNLVVLYQKWQGIFEWEDGPLVKAMKDGDLFLVDEISLADDSVLERLNSVLEPARTLVSQVNYICRHFSLNLLFKLVLFMMVSLLVSVGLMMIVFICVFKV